MEVKESASLETIKEIQGKIKHYEDQRFLAQQKMFIVRQQLEDIDFFFAHFGHFHEFNVVTQSTANERVKREVQFDMISDDIYHFNQRLAQLKADLHKLC